MRTLVVVIVVVVALLCSVTTNASEPFVANACGALNGSFNVDKPSASDASETTYFSWDPQDPGWVKMTRFEILSNAPKGRLYTRTICDEGKCEETAAWMPILVCEKERTDEALAQIEPMVVKNPHTGEENINGVLRNTWRGLITAHNLNLVAKTLGQLQGGAPPMQKPPHVNTTVHVTMEESIRFNSYWFYESKRIKAKPDVEGTGYEKVVELMGH